MRVVLQLFAIISLVVSYVHAADLIEVPGGVMVRTLHDWDGTLGLTVRVDENAKTIKETGVSSSFLFSHQALCSGASYSVLGQFFTLGHPEIFLSNLCRKHDTDPLTFAFISDTQQYHAEHAKTGALLSGLLNDHPIRFVLNGGDIIHDGNETEWRAYRGVASKFYGQQIPVVPVVGNHEYRQDPNLTLYTKVYGTEDNARHYYALDYGVATVIVMNSNIDVLPEAEQTKQTEWLHSTLKAQSHKKPIMVTFHHAPYSSGTGTILMPTCPDYIRKHWAPLFKQYGVSLVLVGHEHIYERLLVDGINYLVAGPAGGKLSILNPFGTAEGSQFRLPKTRTVSLLNIESNGRINLETYADVKGTRTLVDRATY